jgi:beta-lactamase regulating signal transducer with metallopeptidase domain
MLEIALRSTALLGLAFLLARCLRRATASTRHLVWHTAVLAVLALPLLSALGPEIRVPRWPGLAASHWLAEAAPGAAALADNAAGWLDYRPALTPSPASDSPTPSDLANSDAPVRMTSVSVSLALAFWYLLGWTNAAGSVRRARQAPVAWQLETTALCARMRIGREVRVRVSATQTTPVATGLFRSSIVLPIVALDWSPERRRAVLLHELAHIRRRDCGVQVMAQAACAIYWFNPLIWLAVRRLRAERERACDDEVLRHGIQPSTYARHLVDIARSLRGPLHPSAALAMARPSELEGRVLSVLACAQSRVPGRATRWVVAGATVCVAIVVAGIAPVDSSAGAVGERRSERRFVVVTDAMVGADQRQPATSAVRPLELALGDDNQDVREKAAMGLALSSSPDAITPLLRALKDRDSQVREKAAIGLALRRDARIIEPLLDAMDDPDSQVREKIALALGTSGDPRAVTALERALRDPDAQVREKAATGLMLLNTTVDEVTVARVRDGLGTVVGSLLALAR